MRDQAWLEEQLQTIWTNHFGDVTMPNTVTIIWGRGARTRLGSIRAKDGSFDNPTASEIRINTLLQDQAVPQAVVWQTIAHELAHYTHGFCSPHPRKYTHPHRYNVVKKELEARDLSHVYTEAQRWLKANWTTHVTSSIGTKPRKRRTYAKRKRLSLLSHIAQGISRRRRI